MLTRRLFLGRTAAIGISAAAKAAPISDKTVVLTFDDAVKSHRTFVAPLLKELGFGATFFVTHRWMDDRENFMDWQDIAEIHKMGFEIGNHTWTHDDFSSPRNAWRLRGELALVENALAKAGVPKPVSFCYPGNSGGPEALTAVRDHGYKFARRGMTPEVSYEFGLNQLGPLFDPSRHHPLLIPSAGIPDPAWNFEHFKDVVSRARNNLIMVLQFHGVPDLAHPWCHTAPANFRRFMQYLKDNGFRAIAVRDLERYLDLRNPASDPVEQARYPLLKNRRPALPVEVEATQADLDYWLTNMLHHHCYTHREAAQVSGLSEAEVRKKASELQPPPASSGLRVLPYPGGRHPRIGFLEGAYDPLRGTKASIFLPWDPQSYVVVDLPEAIFSNLGLIFLAHTHVPTVWNEQNRVLENIDWNRTPDGGLDFHRLLPNGIIFGATIQPAQDEVRMELWLRNVTHLDLTGLRTQVCVLLKGAKEFNRQTNDNKVYRSPAAAVRSIGQDRWILTAWERAGRLWGNSPSPCMHSDPVFPDCPSGQTVSVRGRLWFYEGRDIDSQLKRAI